MRISTIQAFNNGVTGIQRNYSNVTRTQEQISTGKKILTPADDPVASARLLQLSQEKAQYEQYSANITAAKNSLTQEESILNSVGNVLQRVREIAVQAGDSAQDKTDKAALAKELAEREDELLNLLNSRNARGEYLFSGNLGKNVPFALDPATGEYAYLGDEGQREIQIASSTYLPINDNGKVLFEDVFNANRVTTSKVPSASTATISLGLVEDKLAYDSTFPDATLTATDGFGIRFTSATAYEVFDLAAPAVVLSSGSVDADATTSDVIRYAGVRVAIDGLPAAGDSFAINRNPAVEKRGMLNVVADLRRSLEQAQDSPQGGLVIRDNVAVALTNLDAVLGQVLQGRGEIGARLNVVDSTEAFTEDVSLINTAVQSDLQDLDYAEALSRLSFESVILEAAQQSYVKIAGLSLFDQL